MPESHLTWLDFSLHLYPNPLSTFNSFFLSFFPFLSPFFFFPSHTWPPLPPAHTHTHFFSVPISTTCYFFLAEQVDFNASRNGNITNTLSVMPCSIVTPTSSLFFSSPSCLLSSLILYCLPCPAYPLDIHGAHQGVPSLVAFQRGVAHHTGTAPLIPSHPTLLHPASLHTALHFAHLEHRTSPQLIV